MTIDDYNAFCRALPATTYVVQWGGAHVWKVGGKVFAIGGWQDEGEELFVTFRCSDIAFDMLKDEPGLRPAPYLASRGFKWIQRTAKTSMSDKSLCKYLTQSHYIISQGLPKKTRQSLGLEQPVPVSRSAKSRTSPLPHSHSKRGAQ